MDTVHLGRRYFSKFKLGVPYMFQSNARVTLYRTIKNILNVYINII